MHRHHEIPGQHDEPTRRQGARGERSFAWRRAEAGLLDAAATYFHHATPGLGPHIEVYQNAGWGEKNRERALATMHYLDDVLGRQPYLAGDKFSIADITAFAGFAYADIAKIEMPATLKNLKAWRVRIAGRPSVSHA